MDASRCSWAMLPLRLALGIGMMIHGYPKLFAPGGLDQFAGSLAGMGVPLPEVTAWGVGILEFAGGMLVILGALTRLLSALFIIEMAVAATMVHLPHGFEAGNVIGVGPDGQPIFGMPGYEVNVLYAAGFLALLIAGAGRFSIDSAAGRPWSTRGSMGPPPSRGWREKRVSPWRSRERPPAQ